MQLSEHDLRQLDDAALDALEPAPLRALSKVLLSDLKEARFLVFSNLWVYCFVFV